MGLLESVPAVLLHRLENLHVRIGSGEARLCWSTSLPGQSLLLPCSSSTRNTSPHPENLHCHLMLLQHLRSALRPSASSPSSSGAADVLYGMFATPSTGAQVVCDWLLSSSAFPCRMHKCGWGRRFLGPFFPTSHCV